MGLSNLHNKSHNRAPALPEGSRLERNQFSISRLLRDIRPTKAEYKMVEVVITCSQTTGYSLASLARRQVVDLEGQSLNEGMTSTAVTSSIHCFRPGHKVQHHLGGFPMDTLEETISACFQKI